MERTRLRESTNTTVGYPEHALPGAGNRDGKGRAYVEVASASDQTFCTLPTLWPCGLTAHSTSATWQMRRLDPVAEWMTVRPFKRGSRNGWSLMSEEIVHVYKP